MPTVTLGLQVGQVPESFHALNDRERQAGWAPLGSTEFTFPFFGCPSCAADLLLGSGTGSDGADRLTCTRCDWTYAGWIGSKSKLRDHPPAIFLPTTDSLHQWLHDRSEEHTSELQSLMRSSYAVFCLKKNKLARNMKSEQPTT